MLLLRKILFIIFTIIYLICCPLLVFYALGIIFTPKTQMMSKTGLLDLATQPSGATLFVNNQRLSEKTPTIIRKLLPGSYPVKILLEGYKPWERILTVEPEKATVWDRILLIPQKWPARKISSLSFSYLIALEGLEYLLLRRGPFLKDFYVYRWDRLGREMPQNSSMEGTKDFYSLAPKASLWAESKILRFTATPKSNHLLLEVELNGRIHFLWIRLRETVAAIEDITILFSERPQEIRWDPQNERYLYVLTNGFLNQIDVESKAIYPQIVKDVVAFLPHNKHLYVLNKKGLVERWDSSGRGPEAVLVSLPYENVPQNPAQILTMKIYGSEEDFFFLLTDQGILWSNLEGVPLVKEGVQGISFDENNKRLLIWREHDLGFLDLVEYFQNKELVSLGNLQWHSLKDKTIEGAFWVNDTAQIIFFNHNEVWITDTKPSGPDAIHEVVPIKGRSSILYIDKIATLFYLDRETAELHAVFVVSKIPYWDYALWKTQ